MKRIGDIYRTYQFEIWAIVILTLVACIPRLIDLGTFLTADEKSWIDRSYEFIRAFKEWRFNDMLLTTHPGVTAMWLMGIGITAKIALTGVPYAFSNLHHFITAAQMPIALANTIMIPVIYLLLRQVFYPKRWIPVIATLFLALNPFLIGYSRVAHVDALLGSLLFAAVLATIIYAQQGYSRFWLVVSAVFSILAMLTKAPAIFMIPFFGLVVLVFEGKKTFSKDVMLPRLRGFVEWLLIIIVLTFLVWPVVLWVPNPKGNANIFRKDLVAAAATPHDMSLDYTVEGTHYVATLVARATPITQIGVIVLLIALVVAWKRKRYPKDTKALLLIGGFVVFFVLMMTLGAKKGDRYILPVFLGLDVLAVYGLLILAGTLSRYTRQTKRVTAIGVFVVAFAYLIGNDIWYHPYAIAYSNPLFPDNISQEVGWGEGLDQVGAWLNEHGPDANVASWYPQELQFFTTADVANLSTRDKASTRYVVLYRNMFGRATDHPATEILNEYIGKQDPVFTVKIAGHETAWVYEQSAYERVVGKLVPGFRVGQDVPVPENPTAVEVRVPTYSGTAKSGQLIVELKTERGGSVIESWSTPVSSIVDDEWHAYVDGKPADIYTAYSIFRAAPIPSGTHTVTFVFESPTINRAVQISSISLLLSIVLLAVSRIRPRTT